VTTFGQICLLVALVASGYAAFACFVAWRLAEKGIGAMGAQHPERGGKGDRRLLCAAPGGPIRRRIPVPFSASLLERLGIAAAVVGVSALTAVGAILAVALVVKDFRLAYVAQYSSRLLPWYYALSAFWVGQAGSLLLWAWYVGMLAIVYRLWGGRRAEKETVPRGAQHPEGRSGKRCLSPFPPSVPASVALRQPAFAVLMAYQFFLVALMVFGANPMEPGLAARPEGAGLGPLLQHPAMLLHPPVVFIGYAACAIPFALAVAALMSGRLDAAWVRAARPWALLSWVLLGIGILLGAYWAYEELGWGGYWNWDPVENGSLIPWLTATAMLHAAMAYNQRGGLRRTTLVLAVATFAACNFAAFLTRSGVFSSLHAFSQSPIGWMFLAMFLVLAAGTGVLLVRRRAATACDNPLSGLWAKETAVAASVFALVFLAVLVFAGTVSLPLSIALFPHAVVVGPGFYNGALGPTALLLLVAMAAAPLLRWGAAPETRQRRAVWTAVAAGLTSAGLAWLAGLQQPLIATVVGLAAASATAIVGSALLAAAEKGAVPGQPPVGARRNGPPGAPQKWGRSPFPLLSAFLGALRSRRRTFAGYAMHLALACLAVGVAGSSLGTRQKLARLSQGESLHWAGHDVRFVRLRQHRLPEKLVVQAELEVTGGGTAPFTLLPAQEYYFAQCQWMPEVAIHSTWGGDFYTILHSGEGQDRIQLTVVENPLMRWMWLAGGIVLAAAAPWFWPARRPKKGTGAFCAQHPEGRSGKRRRSPFPGPPPQRAAA
jgi:cytochrome c-type biogenesis protein CcmF